MNLADQILQEERYLSVALAIAGAHASRIKALKDQRMSANTGFQVGDIVEFGPHNRRRRARIISFNEFGLTGRPLKNDGSDSKRKTSCIWLNYDKPKKVQP